MPKTRDGTGPRRLKQFAWFVGLWVASVSALAIVSYLIRSVLKP